MSIIQNLILSFEIHRGVL